MPEGTVAPAAAAPSAPAPSAAAPAVSAPAPVESAAAPVAAPEVAAPAASEVAVPAAEAPQAAEPKQSDYEGDIVGFLEAHNAWERGEEVPAVGEKLPEPAPAAEEKPAEETPAEEDKPWAPEPEQGVTPEAFNQMLKAKPEREAFLEADPELKNAMFAMARTNAKLEPLGKIFPNEASAQFAADTSNTFVNIRTGFLEAMDNPESLPQAYEQFADEFQVKDKDGQPMRDQEGNPVYDEDFHLLNDYVVDTYHDVEISDLTASLEQNQFVSEEERENADMALQAFQFIKKWKAGKLDTNKPDLSGLSPEAKAYYERKEAELADREAKLGGKEKSQTRAERDAAKQTYETDVQRTIGSSVGGRLKQLVADDEKAGVFLPSYITGAKDPKTGISIFAKDLLDKFEEATYGRTDEATGKVVGGVAHIRNQAKMLARRPPSEDAKKARVDFVSQMIDEHLPQIYNQVKRELQRKDIADRQKRQGNSGKREELATREPRGGSAPQPKALDAQTAMGEAYKFVDQAFPDLSPAERTEKALIKKNELMGVR